MKVTLFLKTVSAAKSRQFYVEELGLFRVERSVEDKWCSLQAADGTDVRLELATYNPEPPRESLFSVDVADAHCEYARLKNMSFLSGGRIVVEENIPEGVFEWPGGASFMLEDPAGNRFLLSENYCPSEE